MKFIRSLSIVWLLFSGVVFVAAQEPCNRSLEPEGGFSLCVPEGWEVTKKEGEKYKLYFAPAGERFTANINIKVGESTLALDDYATASVDHILKNFRTFGPTDVKALTKNSFSTRGGLAAIKATFHVEYKEIVIRSIQYYFSDADRKLVLTCTLPDADAATMEPVCDRAAKSFQLIETTNPSKVG